MRFVKMVACPRDGGLKPYFFDVVAAPDNAVVPGPRHGCVDASTCHACTRCWRSVRRSVFAAQKKRSARPARR